jgi:hypothetical protein
VDSGERVDPRPGRQVGRVRMWLPVASGRT